MAIVHVTTGNFDTEVLQSQEPVLADFWAAWCGPCQMLAPTLTELAQEGVKVAKIDVDQCGELAEAFGIVSIPTLLVFKGGQIVNKSVGLIEKSRILSLLDESK